MNYLFKKYRKFTFKRDKFISSIIDNEVKRTKEFGLNIYQEDVEYEKLIFIAVFEYIRKLLIIDFYDDNWIFCSIINKNDSIINVETHFVCDDIFGFENFIKNKKEYLMNR